jgi:hypothetical protein
MKMTRSYFSMASIAIVVVVMASGCADLQVKKIGPGKEDGGLAYCLAVPKLQVTTKEALIYDKIDLNRPPYSLAARSIKDVTVNLVQVPSYEHYYSAKMKSGWFTTDSYSIGYDANGCLNTYTFSTVDQAGTAITTLGSIAVAAVPLFATAGPQVTYPEPSMETYLLERSSRKLLEEAEKKIKELTDKKEKLSQKEREQLKDLLDNAAKLQALLNPTPTRVVKIEYFDLWFQPKESFALSADEYVVQEVIKAEGQSGNCNGIIPCTHGNQVSSFIVGIARRLR